MVVYSLNIWWTSPIFADLGFLFVCPVLSFSSRTKVFFLYDISRSTNAEWSTFLTLIFSHIVTSQQARDIANISPFSFHTAAFLFPSQYSPPHSLLELFQDSHRTITHLILTRGAPWRNTVACFYYRSARGTNSA